MGTYAELLSHDGPFAKFLKIYLAESDDDNSDEMDPECKWGSSMLKKQY